MSSPFAAARSNFCLSVESLLLFFALPVDDAESVSRFKKLKNERGFFFSISERDSIGFAYPKTDCLVEVRGAQDGPPSAGRKRYRYGLSGMLNCDEDEVKRFVCVGARRGTLNPFVAR